MLRIALLFSLAVLMLPISLALAADPSDPADAVLGRWWFPEKNGQMEIFRDKDIYFGKVVKYDDPDALDENNPDPKLRDRKFVGITMLENFTYDSNKKKWVDGTIYDGDSGKTYKCTMWFEDGNLDRLNVRGYIGISLLGRTEIFERVKETDETAAAE